MRKSLTLLFTATSAASVREELITKQLSSKNIKNFIVLTAPPS